MFNKNASLQNRHININNVCNTYMLAKKIIRIDRHDI